MKVQRIYKVIIINNYDYYKKPIGINKYILDFNEFTNRQLIQNFNLLAVKLT